MEKHISPKQTAFHWPIYADATFAGLSVLIPVPLIDIFFERWFRRRMLEAIARYHGRRLQPAVSAVFNRPPGCTWTSCLLVPLWLLFKLLERLSKKILYFLTVKDAVESLSENWHRAFLLNEMLLSGHLDDASTAVVAAQAMEQTLSAAGTSPFTRLAREVVARARHVLRTLWRVVRRGKEDAMVAQERELIGSQWRDFETYLSTLAARYHEEYANLRSAVAERPTS